MDLIRPLVVALIAFGPGCSHARGTSDGDHEATRERTARIAADVAVHVTRWDLALVEATATDVRDAEARDALRTRLRDRYLAGGTAFTVLLELGHRPSSGDPLADPKAWWFALERDGAPERASHVEPLAVDRFPAAGGGTHLRMALLVVFKGPAPTGDVELRIGTEADDGRRPLLGRTVARRGAALRWRADAAP